MSNLRVHPVEAGKACLLCKWLAEPGEADVDPRAAFFCFGFAVGGRELRITLCHEHGVLMAATDRVVAAEVRRRENDPKART